MNRYDELSDAFIKYHAANVKFKSSNESFAKALETAICYYLDVTNTTFTLEGVVQPHLRWFSIDGDLRTPRQLIADAVHSYTNGTFDFAIGFTTEMRAKGNPMHEHIFDFKCTRVEREVTVEAIDTIFSITGNGSAYAGMDRIANEMYLYLLACFNKKLDSDNVRKPIGSDLRPGLSW